MSATSANKENTNSKLVSEALIEIPEHTLLCKIGSGSYGEVWLARHTFGAFRAVKIVSRANFSHQRPYERELSGIQKFEPISRLHEGLMDVLFVGHRRDPDFFYYIMELADDVETGIQIDPSTYRACTMAEIMSGKHILPVRECVSLGLRLASALDFLHGSGLTHRDIKPSNIILAGGVPKLADIGLVTDLGETHSYVGTEGFIAPEGPGTIQADIYSLGKVLYELSTGKDRREYPALPAPRSDPREEREFLELNEILIKACRSDPRQRYDSAVDLQADLQLLQSGNSIKQLRFAQRRLKIATRLALATVIIAAFSLTGYGLAVRTYEREARLRQIADNEARKSGEIARFLENMLSGVGHDVARGLDTKLMNRILDRAAREAQIGLTNFPESKLEVFHALAESYRAVGAFDEAERMFRTNLNLTAQMHGEESLPSAKAMGELANIFTEKEDKSLYPEGVELASKAVLIRKKLLGPEHYDLTELLLILGDLQGRQNKLDEAETSFFQAWQLRRKISGDNDLSTAGALDALAAAVELEGNLEQAKKWFLEVLADRRRWMKETPNADRSLDVAHTAMHLGKHFASQKDHTTAARYFQEALELRKQWLGDHPETLSSLSDLAAALDHSGQSNEAEAFRAEEALLRERLRKP